MAEESSFQGLNLKNSLAVVEAVGMWKSRSDFQGGCETRRVSPTVISTAFAAASFIFPRSRQAAIARRVCAWPAAYAGRLRYGFHRLAAASFIFFRSRQAAIARRVCAWPAAYAGRL